jgi:hypothetical protein
MYTAQEIFNMTCDFISKRNPNGTIDPGKTATYKARAPGILTAWQSIIAKTGDLYNTYEISNSPIPNMFGLLAGLDIREYGATTPLVDLIFEAQGSAKAYYLEVDGPATIYIEDYTTQWNTLTTITAPDTVTSFTPYKGVVVPTTGATKSRIRFSGSYYYRTVNRALFAIPFQADRVPDFKPWVKHSMPSDFKSVDQIIDEYPERQYAKQAGTKWEGRRDLYINYYYNGKVRVVYKPVPIVISALTQTLQVDEIASISGAYFLASHLLLIEDPASASFFQQMYEGLKLETQMKTPASESAIVDIYAINMGG